MSDGESALRTAFLEHCAGGAPDPAALAAALARRAPPAPGDVAALLTRALPSERAESLADFIAAVEGIALGRRRDAEVAAFFGREERWIDARCAGLGIDIPRDEPAASRAALVQAAAARTCAGAESPAALRRAHAEILALGGAADRAAAAGCAAALRAAVLALPRERAAAFMAEWIEDLGARAHGIRGACNDGAGGAANLYAEWKRLDDLARELAVPGARSGARRLGTRLLRSVREERLRARLDRLIGRRAVRALDNLALLLIALMALLLAWELRFAPGPEAARAFAYADAAICALLLADFLFRLCCAGPWYFRSRALLEFFPLLPYALLFDEPALGLEGIPFLRFLAFFRIGSRAATLARPLVSFARLGAFLAGGLDRLVQALRPLLDHEIVIAGEELPVPPRAAPEPGDPFAEIQARCCHGLRVAFRSLGAGEERRFLAAYAWCLGALARAIAADAPAFTAPPPLRRPPACSVRELAARLRAADPVRIELLLGARLAADIASALRHFDLPLLRHLPFVRAFARASRMREPSDAVFEAARALAGMLGRAADAVELYADFRGVGTAPQLVDRVASFVVVRARRVAVRFLLLGSLFLLATVIVYIGGLEVMMPLADTLGRYLGIPIVVLGICSAFVFSLALYLKRLAGEAIETWRATAEAQFITMGKEAKQRRDPQNRALLEERVLAEERRILDAPGGEAWASRAARVEAIYRCWCEGTLLHEGDVKLAEQLLGNVAVQQIRGFCLRESGRDRRRREARSLAVRCGFFFRPHHCFRLLVDTLAVEIAKLIVEYDRHAVPRRELPSLTPEEREAHARWLAAPEEGRRRRGALPWHTEFRGCFFTAAHFLSPDPRALAEVEREFGPETAARVRADRRSLIRELFGVWPWPPLRINPYRAYMQRVRSLRVLFLPVRAAVWAARGLWGAAMRAAGILREIRGGVPDAQVVRNAHAPFSVARRKILRMRRTLLAEAAELAAYADSEYLGVAVPALPARPARTPLAAADELDDELRAMLGRRRRAVEADAARFSRLLATLGWNGGGAAHAARVLAGEDVPDPREAVRACFMTYCLNAGDVKVLVHAEELLREFTGGLRRHAVPERRIPASIRLAGARIRAAFSRRRREARALAARLAPMVPEDDARRRLVPALAAAGPELRAAARLATGDPDARMRARERGRAILARTARAPGFAGEQLVTVRTLHTLAVLDILHYVQLVADIGEYDDGPA